MGGTPRETTVVLNENEVPTSPVPGDACARIAGPAVTFTDGPPAPHVAPTASVTVTEPVKSPVRPNTWFTYSVGPGPEAKAVVPSPNSNSARYGAVPPEIVVENDTVCDTSARDSFVESSVYGAYS